MGHTGLIIARFENSAQTSNLLTRPLTEPSNKSQAFGARDKTIRRSSSTYKTILGTYRSSTVWFRTSVGDESGTDSNVTNQCTTITFEPVIMANVLVWRTRRVFGQVARNFQVYPVNQRVYDDVSAEFENLQRHGLEGETALKSFQHRLNNGLNPFVLNEAGDSILWVCYVPRLV